MDERDPETPPDLVFEEELPPEEAAPAPFESPALRARLRLLENEKKQLEEEKKALVEQLLRRQADFDNFRKRLEREKAEYRQTAQGSVLAELLPVVDAFERALAHEGDAGEDYRKGIELIYKQLSDFLTSAGLEPVPTVGQPFDPNIHHAVESVETRDVPDHQIIAELQRGYSYRDRLLRPALVRVAVHPDSGGS